ncbi:hypothetical protein VCR15J5_470010 [Vibrio crassostreae]|nr:hypothetical protein VCR15J5_470010 [Vibrio crassostreae]
MVKIELKHGVTPCIGHSLKHRLNDRSIIVFKLFGKLSNRIPSLCA